MASITCKQSAFARAASRSGVRGRVAARRPVAVSAKYGENGRFVDLADLENTTGSWDMYGVDEKKRYPDLQNTFFKQATDIISRRESLNAFVALFGVGAIVTYGLKGAADANLPITKGPQTAGENGKGGSVRSRL